MLLDQVLPEMKILMVDDDQLTRSSLTYYFKKKTRAFTAVASAEEALKLLEQEVFDIVLCDYRLPGMDGLVFCGYLQAKHPDMIKILMTAFGTEDLALALQKHVIQEFIQKPFAVKTIALCLERAGRARKQVLAGLHGATDEPPLG